MVNRQGYVRCPICGKERQTTGTGKIINHRRWNGIIMVHCPGSLQRPR